MPSTKAARAPRTCASDLNSSAFLTAGYDFAFDRFNFGPMVSYTSQNVEINAFDESGAGSANLRIRSELLGIPDRRIRLRVRSLQLRPDGVVHVAERRNQCLRRKRRGLREPAHQI